MRYCYLLLLVLFAAACSSPADKPTFSVTLDPAIANDAQDGRLLILLSTDSTAEPRFQINDGLNSQLVFGIDVDGMKPGTAVKVDSAFGYPLTRLEDVPAGEYRAQALLNRYETYNLSNGKTVKLPPDMGEGQQWNRKPGNLYSKPVTVRVEPGGTVQLTIDQVIAPIEPPRDTEYVKHIRIQSKLLSDWWGKPMFIGAHVLVPHGFNEHPEARYPLMVYHGHFPSDFGGFQTTPPDANM
ncbi:MAG: hypothetical protein ACKOYP_03490, partial [Bacteroidota bacterium]